MNSISPNLSPVNTQNLSAVRLDDSRKTVPGQDNNITQKPEKTDQLSLSPAAREMAGRDSTRGKSEIQSNNTTEGSRADGQGTDVNHDKTNLNKTQSDDGDKLTVQKLKLEDLHVKMHEQLHMSAGGAYVRGGPTFEYTTGPDGNRYAVGGEVQIDTSPIRDNPKATIQKAQTVRQAALAPSDPSGADRAIAAKATSMEVEAAEELTTKDGNKKGVSSDSNNSKDPSRTNMANVSPYHKRFSAYQHSRHFSVGNVVNQLA